MVNSCSKSRRWRTSRIIIWFFLFVCFAYSSELGSTDGEEELFGPFECPENIFTIGDGALADEAPRKANDRNSLPSLKLPVPTGKRVRIKLNVCQSRDGICILSKGSELEGVATVPVGRSYKKRFWEPATASSFPDLKYKCKRASRRERRELASNSTGEISRQMEQSLITNNSRRTQRRRDQAAQKKSSCVVALPPLEEDEYYILTKFTEPTGLSQRDKVARFFERTTFGPTKSTIDTFISSGNYSWDWVYKQMYDTPMTLHRAYYRERVDTRWDRPYHIGDVTRPCDANSRWTEAAFTSRDAGKLMKVTLVSKNKWELSVDGYLRTVVDDVSMADSSVSDLEDGEEYRICDSTEVSTFHIQRDRCRAMSAVPMVNMQSNYSVWVSNHAVSLPNLDTFTVVGESKWGREFLQPIALKKSFCRHLPSDYNIPVFGETADGKMLLHDQHLVLAENSLETPSMDGGGLVQYQTMGAVMCSNTPRSFQNEDACVLSDVSHVCNKNLKFDSDVTLNNETIRLLFTKGGRYVYAIDGLTLDPSLVPSPCLPETTSRWERATGACKSPTQLESETLSVLKTAISKSSDTGNPTFRDISVSTSGMVTCHLNDLSTIEISITVDGDCWTHVHPDKMSVYDFEYWTRPNTHVGNAKAKALGHRHPIKKWANSGHTVLTYPTTHKQSSKYDHPLARWHDSRDRFTLIGRLGDTVRFTDLPGYFQLDPDVVKALNVTEIGGEDKYKSKMVCGSPGEVANLPHKKVESYRMATPLSDKVPTGTFDHQRDSVWTTIALNSEDQLRQRVAWALSQIVQIIPGDLSRKVSEVMFTNYDIFVRHAFGNFRDILREMAHNSVTADTLSFLYSKSVEFMVQNEGRYTFPDENFAREIMQLFTIGLYQLNEDGTLELDKDENKILTYTNEDIMSFARAWTGFALPSKRGNLEELHNFVNRIDPMQINVQWRDRYPKTNLHGGFIGDQYPLCADLPSRSFLRTGAKYRLLGSDPTPELVKEGAWINNAQPGDHISLRKETSELYNVLCNATSDDKCQFPSLVTLDSNLACDGDECNVETIRVVMVSNLYYEYVRLPCVELAFYDNPKTIRPLQAHFGTMCANPLLPAAIEACCDKSRNPLRAFFQKCSYVGERVTFATAEDRCMSAGRSTCDFSYVDRFGGHCDKCCKFNQGYHWHESGCSLKVKVRKVDGYVSIVHRPNDASQVVPQHLDQETLNFFRIFWDEEIYPNSGELLCGPCVLMSTGDCLCNTDVVEDTVFTSLPSSAEEILKELPVGSVPISMYDEGHFDKIIRGSNFRAYSKSGRCCDKDTVFEVDDDRTGRVITLKNTRENVQIIDLAGRKSKYSFRNPPHFISLSQLDTELRDAQHETEAVLDEYFYHKNTAPFISTRLIQRFGISNPSPGYVGRVSKAFSQGVHREGGLYFGSDQYGDLAATVAAIVLDQDATNEVFDSDPAHGSLREPILKVMAVLRALEYTPKPEFTNVELRHMEQRLGQMVFESPTVFSFFLSDYSPEGPVADANLVAPEAQLYDTPKIISLMNGLFSLVRYGLTRCNEGFGTLNSHCSRDEGGHSEAAGQLAYTPPNDADTMIDELSSLLTSGRLGKRNKNIIKAAVGAEKDSEKALRLAQQLIIASPEFHGTGTVAHSGAKRATTQKISAPKKPYKAVVYLLLRGGLDSFNVLVPHSGCGETDMYEQYRSIRRTVALGKGSLLPISANTKQVCSTFGINKDLSVLKDLYVAGDAVIFANSGAMSKPVTKDNYQQSMNGLFAHNAMQEEIKRLDPNSEHPHTGVLGRVADALTRNGIKSRAAAVDAGTVPLVGKLKATPPIYSLSNSGVEDFNKKPSTSDMNDIVKELNEATLVGTNVFAETWSAKLHQALEQNEVLGRALGPAKTTKHFPDTSLGRDLEVVSRLIKVRKEMGVERDIFFVETLDFDHHAKLHENLRNMLREVNGALKAFADEMKAQGNWDNVALLETSDFGRTLTPNSGAGTDHAWAGHTFMMGGSVQGSQILGKYPSDLTDSSELNAGRGRLIPTMSFDEIMNGVAEWIGVDTDEQLDYVLPNRGNFENLFSASELFSKGEK